VIEKGGADPQSPKIEPLGKKHDRVVFSCGDEALDTYLNNNSSLIPFTQFQPATKLITYLFLTSSHQFFYIFPPTP